MTTLEVLDHNLNSQMTRIILVGLTLITDVIDKCVIGDFSLTDLMYVYLNDLY